jgi:hypothetical protein
MRRRPIILVSVLALALVPGPLPAGAGPQDAASPELAPLLDAIAARSAAYVPLESWRASVRTVQTKVDKNWNPEKVTTVSRVVTVRKDDYDERILKAEETEKGRTRDITADYAGDSRERIEKQRRREAERKAKGGAAAGQDGGRREMSLKDFLPFDPSRRGDFAFVRLPDAEFDGAAAIVLEVRARVKDEKNWEGTYYVAPGRFDILKVVLRPSKNPRFVKELEMEMTLQVLPGEHLVLRSSRARVNAGMFLKHVRMISEDAYSDYEIFGDDTNEAGSEARPRPCFPPDSTDSEVTL